MSINPKDDEIRIQAAVGAEVLQFLIAECKQHRGVLSIDDFKEFQVLNYGISLPEHVPKEYAHKLIHRTIKVILGVVMSVMDEFEIKQLDLRTLKMMGEKFNKDFLYNAIKETYNIGGDNENE